jgi:hypothetical protein
MTEQTDGFKLPDGAVEIVHDLDIRFVLVAFVAGALIVGAIVLLVGRSGSEEQE